MICLHLTYNRVHATLHVIITTRMECKIWNTLRPRLELCVALEVGVGHAVVHGDAVPLLLLPLPPRHVPVGIILTWNGKYFCEAGNIFVRHKIFFLENYHYLQAKKIRMKVSINMRPANMKNSLACSEKARDSATMMTMMLPPATVSSQAACMTDFMLAGAWL